MIQKLLLVTRIAANAVPMLVMIALIPLVPNDTVLTVIYIGFIVVGLALRQDKQDLIFVAFGFFALLFFEYLFVSTGVETFTRASLFGVMPLWLPFLWAYVFIAVRSAVRALDRYVATT